MIFAQKKILFGLTNVYSLFEKTIKEIEILVNHGAEIIPIISVEFNIIDNKTEEFINKIKVITKTEIVKKHEEIEELINNNTIDVMIIAPCSGNILAKLANSISDSEIIIIAKHYLKYGNPLVLGIYANDGLSRKC